MFFSKIGYFIRPLLLNKEDVAKPDPKKEREPGGKRENSAEEEDVTLFSTAAIRALLIQEKPDALDEYLAKLDLLERNAITSIPVYMNQSVLAAISAAVSVLNGKM